VAKDRFVFGKDMSDEQMWEAFKKMAEGYGFKCKDTHKKKVAAEKVPKTSTLRKTKKRIGD
jgi:hypothetical protein